MDKVCEQVCPSKSNIKKKKQKRGGGQLNIVQEKKT